MSENKNMELNDEMMAKVSGGDGDSDRARYSIGVVREHWDDAYGDKWVVDTESNGEIIASYGAIGVEPIGRKVKCALVGMGKWDIVEFMD